MSMTKYWPRAVTLFMAFLPVVALLYVFLTLSAGAFDALRYVSLGNLLGLQYAPGLVKYGLMPAFLSTVLVVLITMAFAFPTALAMAVFATEYPLGFLGKGMNVILGLLAGVPPVIYALLSSALASLIIVPKFCAPTMLESTVSQLPGLTWYNAGMLPKEGSILLAGMILALMIIPFMAPLIADSIRNVPHGTKEASYGLGASRWHTLRKIVLPTAGSGLLSAATLGTLKALGDVLIVAWIVNYQIKVPNPFFDLFERAAPLTSAGATLAGGSLSDVSCDGIRCSIAYFSGFMLLILAFVILGITTVLHKRFQRRMGS